MASTSFPFPPLEESPLYGSLSLTHSQGILPSFSDLVTTLSRKPENLFFLPAASFSSVLSSFLSHSPSVLLWFLPYWGEFLSAFGQRWPCAMCWRRMNDPPTPNSWQPVKQPRGNLSVCSSIKWTQTCPCLHSRPHAPWGWQSHTPIHSTAAFSATLSPFGPCACVVMASKHKSYRKSYLPSPPSNCKPQAFPNFNAHLYNNWKKICQKINNALLGFISMIVTTQEIKFWSSPVKSPPSCKNIFLQDQCPVDPGWPLCSLKTYSLKNYQSETNIHTRMNWLNQMTNVKYPLGSTERKSKRLSGQLIMPTKIWRCPQNFSNLVDIVTTKSPALLTRTEKGDLKDLYII